MNTNICMCIMYMYIVVSIIIIFIITIIIRKKIGMITALSLTVVVIGLIHVSRHSHEIVLDLCLVSLFHFIQKKFVLHFCIGK